MESFMPDLAKSYVEKLIKGALVESSYICCFTCIAKDFEEEKARLVSESKTIKERVEVATNRGEDIQSNVDYWEKEADKLIQEDTKTNQKCCFGFCPNCIWRYIRGKELANKKDRIKELMKTGKELSIGLPARLPGVESNQPQFYISFKSRESIYNELLDALKDDNNYIIGLQGMGGTGKTTLAIKVGNELEQSKQFTKAIITTVSNSPDIKKIQDDIAGPLGLNLNDDSESDRPKKLWKRLTQGEKILLILDDVWGDLDFKEIGIPYNDNNKGCRVLVTTRQISVCNRMGCNKTIQLELLSEEDAWNMFKRHAGLCSNSSKSLLGKAHKIANECKRLPIAIAAIASSLKGEQRPEEWDAALKSLQKHMSMRGGDDGDELDKIYKCLKFSYDNMKNEKAKRLFLLCSVFQEDENIPIERLTRFGIGAGIFGEDYDSYEDARSQVVISKNKLLDSCLLLKANQEESVKMHDLVRDAAQRIAKKKIQTINISNKNEKALVERENNIKYLLCQGKLMDVLSCKFGGYELEILIVYMHEDGGWDNVNVEFPNTFFGNNTGLRVFHILFDFNFYKPTLPFIQSIQSLKNIRSFLFENVNLGDISILGNMHSLETLDLVSCKINELPHGITKLEKLRLLNLDSCEILRNNPFEVIKGCSLLEELYFLYSFNIFCQEISFPKLKIFHIKDNFTSRHSPLIKCVSVIYFERVLSESTLKYCMQTAEVLQLRRIEKGWRNLMPEIVPVDQDIQLTNIAKIKSVFILFIVPRMLLETLTIENCDELKHIIIDTEDHDSCNNNLGNVLPKLKNLNVRNCVELEYIFGHYVDDHQNHIEIHIHLPALECLVLQNLPSLAAMCSKQYHITFPPLKELEFQKCDDVAFKSIGDFLTHHSITRSVDRTTMKVDIKSIGDFITPHSLTRSMDGASMKELSGKMDHVNEKQMNIKCLPQLQSLIIEECKELKHIIEDDTENQKTSNSNSLCSRTCFPKLEALAVVKCNKLKSVFPVSICKELPELKVLMIKEANELEEIFKSECDNQKVEVPNLKIVAFVNLPSLCQNQGIQFQAVENRFVQNCQNLSLTCDSTTDSKINIFHISYSNLDYETCLILESLFAQLQEEYEGSDTGSEGPSTKTTKDFAAEIEVEAASEHKLTFSQELMNEQLMDPLGEIDNTVKPSQDTEISVEEGTTLTPSTHLILEQDVDVIDSVETTKTNNDKVSVIDDAVMKVSSIIEKHFPKDDVTTVSESKPSPSNSIPLSLAFQTPSEGNPSQIVQDLSSTSLVTWELEQLVSNKHLNYENLSVLTDFLVKHPSVLLRDSSVSNRYKGYAYNCLAELLKFLQTHSVLDVLGSSHSEFVELLQDMRRFAFDKDWLDDVEKRALFPNLQFSQDALQKLLDSQQRVTKEVEEIRLKINIFTQHVGDLKKQLASYEAFLETIMQEKAKVLETKAALSSPIGY
uniref:NBS-LRR protein n=1 Tax=Cicer arietinum TaxID=3827 RepID=W0LWI0_CICAR|nr:NBS-LRR protein [Cicer arietinum]